MTGTLEYALHTDNADLDWNIRKFAAAISELSAINSTDRFYEYNGSTWTATTVITSPSIQMEGAAEDTDGSYLAISDTNARWNS